MRMCDICANSVIIIIIQYILYFSKKVLFSNRGVIMRRVSSTEKRKGGGCEVKCVTVEYSSDSKIIAGSVVLVQCGDGAYSIIS